MSFSYLFNNILLSSGILRSSLENKSEFGNKGQNRLELNPPLGLAYGGLITASRSALDLFITLKDGTTMNMQMAATQRLDAMMPLIRITGEVLEAKILTEFENDPAVRTEFFPGGRTELSKAKRGDMAGILGRLEGRAAAHVTQLGATWVTRLTNLKNMWNSNLAIQNGASGGVVASRSQIDMAWESFAWAVYDIHLQLAVDNPKNAGVVDGYFDFSVFSGRTNYDNDGLGKVNLHVTNYSDEPLVNARITVKSNTDQQIRHEGMTNDEGLYATVNLPIGFYDVLVSFPNYLSVVMQYQVFDNRDPLHEVKLTHE